MKTPKSRATAKPGAARAKEVLPTPQEAAALAKKIKARMRARTARYCRTDDLRRAAFSFGFFPQLPEVDYQREAEQLVRDSWEQTGDCLRLAMMEWSMGEHSLEEHDGKEHDDAA